jgi:hypothetical protein
MLSAELTIKVECDRCPASMLFTNRVHEGERNFELGFTARSQSRNRGWDTARDGERILDLCPKCKAGLGAA